MNKTDVRQGASLFVLASLAVGVAPLPVFAQDAGEGEPVLEEVRVSARRIDEDLMRVPMAITAMTASAIEGAGIKGLDQLSQFTPGMHIDLGLTNSLSRNLNFRGLSVSSGQEFIDGVSISGIGVPYLGDLERVEVLVGPQSTYFGRATFQGALNYVTRRPSNTFSGNIAAEYGSYGTSEVAASFEGPLIDDVLSARISARQFEEEGQYRNYSDPSERMGWRRETSISSSIYYKPTENLKFNVFLNRSLADSGPPAAIALKGSHLPQYGGSGTQVPGVTGGSQELFCDTQGTFGTYHCGALPDADEIDPRIISGNFDLTPYLQGIFFDNRLGVPMHFDPRFLTHYGGKALAHMVHLQAEYEFASGWTLSSITAYHHTKSQSINTPNYRDARDVPNPNYNDPIPAGLPCCRLPYISFHLMMQNVNEDYNQEFRLSSPQDGRLRGTVGVNYLRQKTPGGTNFGQSKTVPQYQGSLTRQDTKTPAIFGGIYYDLLDNLHLGAEARYQSDEVIAQTYYANGAYVTRDPSSQTFKTFSPRVTIDYNVTPDSMLFALYSRGYRRGGYNAILVGQPQSVIDQLAPLGAAVEYDQESLDNFELGLKSTWLGGRARTRVVGYYQLWRDGQVPSTISYTQPNGGVVNTTVTTNVGAVDLFGVELEADLAVTNRLTVNAMFNYQGSEIKRYNYIPVGNQIQRDTDIEGNHFWGSPTFKGAISPVYRAPLTDGWNWFARADYRFRGKYYIDGTNLAWLDPNHLVDVRFGADASSGLRLEGYITNLFDDRSFNQGEYGADSTSSVGGSNENEIRLGLPRKRTFGFRATYSF
jgi:iron complex outermembrane receptor protein